MRSTKKSPCHSCNSFYSNAESYFQLSTPKTYFLYLTSGEVVSSSVEIRIECLVLAFVGGQSQIQLKFFKQAAE